MISKFKDYDMKSWTDEHFVKVQDPPLSGSNRIVFKNGTEERPTGFLSYSACGTVTVRNPLNSHLTVDSELSPGLTRLCFYPLLQGAVLYGHYGQESDFMMLRNRIVDLSGRVLLLRAGRNSFAEKVRGGPSL